MSGHELAPLFSWRAALSDSGLPPTSRHVALALSLYMNERGGSAFPSAGRLSHDTGLSERAVRQHLGGLRDAGWLVLREQGGLKGETRRANRYEACVPLQQIQGLETTPESDDTDPCISRPRPLQEVHPNSPGLLHGTRDESSPQGLSWVDEEFEARRGWNASNPKCKNEECVNGWVYSEKNLGLVRCEVCNVAEAS